MPSTDLDDLLERVVEIADAPNVRALVLLGSLARGAANRWSDIDVERWVGKDEDVFETAPNFVGERLLMVSTRTVADVRAELRAPDKAIWAVPAYRSMRVLRDPYGDAAEMRRAASAFSWEALHEEADVFVRTAVRKCAEFVHKIRAATERRDEWAALHAAGSQIGRCARIVAVAKGIFVRTENEYFDAVAHAAGPGWAGAFRASFGLDGEYGAFAQAGASTRLYRETVRTVDDRLDEATRHFARRVLA